MTTRTRFSATAGNNNSKGLPFHILLLYTLLPLRYDQPSFQFPVNLLKISNKKEHFKDFYIIYTKISFPSKNYGRIAAFPDDGLTVRIE